MRKPSPSQPGQSRRAAPQVIVERNLLISHIKNAVAKEAARYVQVIEDILAPIDLDLGRGRHIEIVFAVVSGGSPIEGDQIPEEVRVKLQSHHRDFCLSVGLDAFSHVFDRAEMDTVGGRTTFTLSHAGINSAIEAKLGITSAGVFTAFIDHSYDTGWQVQGGSLELLDHIPLKDYSAVFHAQWKHGPSVDVESV